MKNIPAELRSVVDRLSESVCIGFENIVGRGVDIGMPTTWSDETFEARKLPIRAVVMRVDAPLRDCLIGVGAAHLEKLAPLMESATAAILDDLGLDADALRTGETAEYVSGDDASEQLDGIWGEVAINYGLPTGDIVVVFGTGLLQSAQACMNGVPDVLPVLLDPLVKAPDGRYAFGDGEIGVSQDTELESDQAHRELDHELMTDDVQIEGEHELATDGAVAPDTSDHLETAAMAYQPVDSLETSAAHLPESVHQPAPAHVPAATESHPVVVPPAAAPALPPMSAAAQRWSSLLSGVHVEVTAELGRTDLPLGDIASLVADSVLSLDQMVDEPLTVFVNGTKFATARLVVVGDEYGIEILDVLEPSDHGTLLAA